MASRPTAALKAEPLNETAAVYLSIDLQPNLCMGPINEDQNFLPLIFTRARQPVKPRYPDALASHGQLHSTSSRTKNCPRFAEAGRLKTRSGERKSFVQS